MIYTDCCLTYGMAGWSDHEDVHPEDKKYSVVRMDEWKAPSDDDFAIKIAEIDSLDEEPTTVAGRGESIVILDEDGNTVSVTEGPDHPTDTTMRDETDSA
jgi:hypothetical protein